VASSLKSVSSTPALVDPRPLANAKAMSLAFPLALRSTAMRDGTPKPSRNVWRTMRPGDLGATMITSFEAGGSMRLNVMANPWANSSAAPLFRLGAICSA